MAIANQKAEMTASEVIAQIHEHGKKFADDRAKSPNLIANANFSAQGDINIFMIDDLEGNKNLVPCDPIYQLAPGNSRGSRHCLDPQSVATAKFYRVKNPNALQGYGWVNDKETVITHPEHGNQVLSPGSYFVTYQRQYAEDLRRMMD